MKPRLLAPTLRAWLCAACAAPLAAQAGDVPGEEQPPLPAELAVPAAPALSPADELATLRVAPGFRVELVACEPLVRDPVAITFDARGDLWAVEMTGYMPDVDGRGEDAPVGAIVVLGDTDGDGRMDARTVFLDGLVLPRAVAPVRGGALVLAPPELLYCRDTDGDGRADVSEVVDRGLGGIVSPEHAINALLPTLDNALHCANVPWRYAFDGESFVREATMGGGQWGAGRDDLGRIFTNSNSDALRADLVPATYVARHPDLDLRRTRGLNVRVVDDQSVRSARMNPGVNRGYQQGLLDERYHLRNYTAACSPWIARGEWLGPARGDAFVCEPSGNLVARYGLVADGTGGLAGEPRRYLREGRELDFLTSSDERFRPVALCDGPDGALYVADMYRGLIQHRLFVTSFLRAQVVERGLERPIGRGRIWRVVADDSRPAPLVDLAEASWTELAALLDSPSGWRRDAAQRIFVEEGADDRDAHELARQAAAGAATPLGRAHALWALSGMGGVRREVALAALADADAFVRETAVRVSEPLAAAGDAEILAGWLAVARTGDAHLRRQVLLSLGEVRTPAALAAVSELLVTGEDREVDWLVLPALSGLAGRELDLVELALAQPSPVDSLGGREPAPGEPRPWGQAVSVVRARTLALCAEAIARAGRSDAIERVIELAGGRRIARWQRQVLFSGLLAGRPKTPLGEPGPLRLAREPEGLAVLLAGETPEAAELAAVLAWPGRPGFEETPVRPLDAAEQRAFARGAELYAGTCAACHAASGRGTRGVAPALRNSPYVLGPPERLARILLHGLAGPVEIDGELWDAEMPAFRTSDAELAALATYVRREWGHGAEPIDEAGVRAVREGSTRDRPWTAAELD